MASSFNLSDTHIYRHTQTVEGTMVDYSGGSIEQQSPTHWPHGLQIASNTVTNMITDMLHN